MDGNKDVIVKRLEACGIYPTPQRVKIAQVMLVREQHMSADKVLQAVNITESAVSKATVYNTLGLFANKGLVREVIVDPSKVFYDSNTSEHHHFYNVDTGELSDVGTGDVLIDRLPEMPEATELDGVDVIIRLRHKSS